MQELLRRSPVRLFLGVTFLIAAVLAALDIAGVIEAGDLAESLWPLILIAIAALHLITGPWRNLGAWLVLAFGLFALLFTLDILPGDAWALMLPAVLALIGIWVLLGRGVARTYDDADVVRSLGAFGAAEMVQTSQRFAGGSIIQIFGGATLDLRRAGLAPDGAAIDALVAFGGIDIIVPRGWRVSMSGIPIFGGYSNKATEPVAPEPDGPPPPHLSVNAFAIFGGIDVKYDPD